MKGSKCLENQYNKANYKVHHKKGAGLKKKSHIQDRPKRKQIITQFWLFGCFWNFLFVARHTFLMHYPKNFSADGQPAWITSNPQPKMRHGGSMKSKGFVCSVGLFVINAMQVIFLGLCWFNPNESEIDDKTEDKNNKTRSKANLHWAKNKKEVSFFKLLSNRELALLLFVGLLIKQKHAKYVNCTNTTISLTKS